jgi:hypothetical protein
MSLRKVYRSMLVLQKHIFDLAKLFMNLDEVNFSALIVCQGIISKKGLTNQTL